MTAMTAEEFLADMQNVTVGQMIADAQALAYAATTVQDMRNKEGELLFPSIAMALGALAQLAAKREEHANAMTEIAGVLTGVVERQAEALESIAATLSEIRKTNERRNDLLTRIGARQ